MTIDHAEALADIAANVTAQKNQQTINTPGPHQPPWERYAPDLAERVVEECTHSTRSADELHDADQTISELQAAVRMLAVLVYDQPPSYADVKRAGEYICTGKKPS